MVVWPDAVDPLGGEGIETLAAETRERLGPAPAPADPPLVSIVVVNRDGAGHLRRLLRGLVERTDYERIELILVDNGSSDDSLDFIRRVEAPFPISIVANAHNESFSDANNQGAELAGGELVLLLNNDVEPFERSWLRELVACLRRHEAGIAGATLVFPKEGSAWGYLVQHRAMMLLDGPDYHHADLRGHGDDPFAEGFGEDAESPVPTGACMLIERDLLRAVGGLTHGYVYGGEDIDLGLKVLERGRPVVTSGRSVLIHRFSSTRRKDEPGQWRAAGLRNRRVLWERWGARVRREYALDRIAGGGTWAAPDQPPLSDGPSREQILALGFCLKSSEPPPPAPEVDPLERLRAELERRGHLNAVLREDAVEDLAGFGYDVAVHLRGPARYIPRPAQLNVLWVVSHRGAVTAIECDRYDLIATDDAGTADRLRRAGASTPVVRLVAERQPAELLDAVLARADELAVPTRIRAGRPGL